MKSEQGDVLQQVMGDLLAAGFTHLEREPVTGLRSVRPDLVAWGTDADGAFTPQVCVEVFQAELGHRNKASALAQLSAASATLGTAFNLVNANGQWFEADAGFIDLHPIDALPQAQVGAAIISDPEVLRRLISKKMQAATQNLRRDESSIEWSLISRILGELSSDQNGQIRGLLDGATVMGQPLAKEIVTLLGQAARGGGGEHLTPNSVSVAMANVAQARSGEIILDPFAGAGGVLLGAAATLPDVTVPLRGYEINTEVLDLCRQLLELAGVPFQLQARDSMLSKWDPADVVITNPPMGLRANETITLPFGRSNNGEVIAIARGALALKSGGRAVFVTTRGWTFRSGDSAALREWLAENFRISALIGLPPVLTGTQVSPLMTVIDDAPPSSTLVADLSPDWQEQLARHSELIAQIPRIA